MELIGLKSKKVKKIGGSLIVAITEELKTLGAEEGDKVTVILKKDRYGYLITIREGVNLNCLVRKDEIV